MLPLNTELVLPSRAFWYVALRSLVVAFLVLLFGSLLQLLSSLPGATCNGHPCNPASGAHMAAFVYLFSAALVVLAVLNFKWFSFVVTDRNITITSGVLNRSSNTIRFDRIQDVNVSRDPLHMLLGLASVSIWTASPDQRTGNSRRPDGRIVLEADAAEWLRDYLSDPPAIAAGAAPGKIQPATGAAAHGGNGAVIVAVLAVAVLVLMAAMAAVKRSPPASAAEATAAASPGTDRRTHMHVVHGASGPVSASAPPPVAEVHLPVGDYGVVCSIDPPAQKGAVRACADLPLAERCDHESDFPSKPTAEAAILTVVNKSSAPLKFYWLNQAGNRALYATLPPGAHLDQQSHLGAHWLFANAEGQCLGVLDAATMKVGIF